MSHTMDFISLLRPKRPDFLTTLTPEEQATIGKHRDYVKDLIAQEKIVMSGAAIDGTIGFSYFVWIQQKQPGDFFIMIRQ